jgi:hypothetical protein
LGEAAAGGDHSHPHSHQNLLLKPPRGEGGDDESSEKASESSTKQTDKTAIPVSAELAAYVARKTT